MERPAEGKFRKLESLSLTMSAQPAEVARSISSKECNELTEQAESGKHIEEVQPLTIKGFQDAIHHGKIEGYKCRK